MISQFLILKQDLANAISKVSRAELDKRIPKIELFLGEYAYFEDIETRHLDPVNELGIGFAESSSFDLALLYLLLAEIITKQIEANNNQENLRLVNYGIDAINKSDFSFREEKKQSNLFKNIIKSKDRETVAKLNEAKYAPLNKLLAKIFSLYEPTIFELIRDKKSPTYFNIARRIAPQVEPENRTAKKKKKYLLGDKVDQVGAIKARLEKAVVAGDLKSTRFYKKK